MVPVERIELPTFGLQNRCSTAELNRQTFRATIAKGGFVAFAAKIKMMSAGRRAVKYQTWLPRATAKAPSGGQVRSRNRMVHSTGESGWSAMADRLPFLGCVLLLCLVAGPIARPLAVHAADPEFCKRYQVHGALARPRCGACLQGTRWSAEFPVQYEWCLGVSAATAGAERDARAQQLQVCTDR